jgi:hypothetical protein
MKNTEMKRKNTGKINSKKSIENPKTDLMNISPFHEVFPLTLVYKNDEEKKVCYFQCKDHLDSYIKRYKVKKSMIAIEKTKPKEIVTN